MAFSSELDLSHLSQDEIIHIKEVITRAKVDSDIKISEVYGKQKNIKSDDVIQSVWTKRHVALKYFSGSDIVIAALPKSEHLETLDSNAENTERVIEDANSDNIPNYIFNVVLNDIIDEIEKKINDKESERNDSLSYEENIDQKESMSSTSDGLKDATIDNPPSPSIAILEEKKTESPIKEIQSGNDTEKVTESQDQAIEGTGLLDISLTYFPPGHSPNTQRTITRKSGSSTSQDTSVVARKDYVLLTGAKLSILKGTESGAREDDDAELHIEIHGAHNISLSPGVTKNKSRTYVKCYMIPDRFHAAKMRSSVVKGCNSPIYNHKFVYRGFNKTEFEDRCFEILVCGLTFTIGKAVVVGGVRLSSRDETTDTKLGSNENELSLWQQAFDHPSEEANACLSLRLNMKPTYY